MALEKMAITKAMRINWIGIEYKVHYVRFNVQVALLQFIYWDWIFRWFYGVKAMRLTK